MTTTGTPHDCLDGQPAVFLVNVPRARAPRDEVA